MTQYHIIQEPDGPLFRDELYNAKFLETLPEGSRFLLHAWMYKGDIFSLTDLGHAMRRSNDSSSYSILETPDMESLPEAFKDFALSQGVILHDLKDEFTMKQRYLPLGKGDGGPCTLTTTGNPGMVAKLYDEIPSCVNSQDIDYLVEQIENSIELQQCLSRKTLFGKQRLRKFLFHYGIEMKVKRAGEEDFEIHTFGSETRYILKPTIKTIESKLRYLQD